MASHMKISQVHQIGLAAGYILYGFAGGLITYQMFFPLPDDSYNGMAILFSFTCLLLGSVPLAVVRADGRRAISPDDKHDT